MWQLAAGRAVTNFPVPVSEDLCSGEHQAQQPPVQYTVQNTVHSTVTPHQTQQHVTGMAAVATDTGDIDAGEVSVSVSL